MTDLFAQEFLCFSKDKFSNPFKVELVTESSKKDVTEKNILLGYSPQLIIGIPRDEEKVNQDVSLNFVLEKFVVAFLKMHYLNTVQAGDSHLDIYKGVNGRHKFLPPLTKFQIGLKQYLRSLKKGNIRLKGNTYDQVRIAYSVPREIVIATTGNGEVFNIFPTDLHGRINKDCYIDSFRIGGKACEQIEQNGKFVLAKIDAKHFDTVYKLGKNHMAEMKPADELDICFNPKSDAFGFPLHEDTISYVELERLSSFDQGLHRIHLFKIINEKILRDANNSLAHINHYSAVWRQSKGIDTEYLFR